MFKFFNLFAFAVLGAAFANSAWSVQPESGMWAFKDELNGKPGRGFQIDTQGGKFVIVSYFGYRTDGSALFLQASGELTNTPQVQFPWSPSTFEGDLVEYKNGPAIAGPRQDGVTAAVVGKLKLSFESPTSGSIVLPGEEPKQITRFQYEDSSAAFNIRAPNPIGFRGVMESNGGSAHFSTEMQKYNFKLLNGVFDLERTGASGSCRFTGTYTLAGKGVVSSGTFTCSDSSTGTYRTGQLTTGENGTYTGNIYRRLVPSPFSGEITEIHYGLCIAHNFMVDEPCVRQ